MDQRVAREASSVELVEDPSAEAQSSVDPARVGAVPPAHLEGGDADWQSVGTGPPLTPCLQRRQNYPIHRCTLPRLLLRPLRE